MPKLLHSLLIAALSALPLFGDNVLHRTKVPNALFPQGEVQLVEKGHEAIVRSEIRTRYPNKVLAKIIRSEEANWPNNPDMQTYIAALKEVMALYTADKTDKTLIIDFVSGPAARVDFFYPAPDRWRSLPLSNEYVRKNQEFILADAFGRNAGEVLSALEKLNPKEAAHAER